MGNLETNIYKIAKEAGVSIATVSRVMNHSTVVSEKTTQKVMRAVEKYNYVPNIAARNLSTSTSTSVGVVIPDINNQFFMQLLQGITAAADALGLTIFLFDTDESTEREHRVLDSMREHRVCGIIITPVSSTDAQTREKLQNFRALEIPVVLVDREVDDSNFDSVVTEDAAGAFSAVSELIRQGHEKIAIITGPEISRPGRERLEGFRRAMEQAGLPIREEYIRKSNFRAACAYEQALALCRLPEPPTAIVSSNNMTTYGCLKAFNELNLEVGRDIALLGFDDIEELGWLNYHISVISRDVQNMGEQAMQLLRRRITKECTSENGTRITLPTKLILRGSEQYPWKIPNK